jgi:hypothetical protein
VFELTLLLFLFLPRDHLSDRPLLRLVVSNRQLLREQLDRSGCSFQQRLVDDCTREVSAVGLLGAVAAVLFQRVQTPSAVTVRATRNTAFARHRMPSAQVPIQ